MAENLRGFEKLVFDSRLIRPDAFDELAKNNAGLREVCIRVFPQEAVDGDPNLPHVHRVAGWICSFANIAAMEPISIGQRDPFLDDVPFICLDEIRDDVRDQCPHLRENWYIHIQVFSQVLNL